MSYKESAVINGTQQITAANKETKNRAWNSVCNFCTSSLSTASASFCSRMKCIYSSGSDQCPERSSASAFDNYDQLTNLCTRAQWEYFHHTHWIRHSECLFQCCQWEIDYLRELQFEDNDTAFQQAKAPTYATYVKNLLNSLDIIERNDHSLHWIEKFYKTLI